MIRVSHSTGGRGLDQTRLWDRQGSEEIADDLIEAIHWQTARGRGADGKKFRPYAESTVKRRKLRPTQAKKVTLKRTGRLLTVVREGAAGMGGLVRFVNEKSAGLKLDYKSPGHEGYLYVWSRRRFLGWNRKAEKLAKAIIERTVTRLIAEQESGQNRGDWPGAAQPPSRPAALGRRAA